MKISVSEKFFGLHAGLCGLAAASSLVLVACAGNDPMPDELAGGGVDTVEQAYSDQECQAASPNATGTLTASTGYFASTPVTYSNAKAFKSYVWDVTARSVVNEVYPVLSLVTGTSGFPPNDYDTSDECTALSFNRRLYRKAAGTGAAYVLYAEGFAHGVWDTDYGCRLPRYFGPDNQFGKLPPLDPLSIDQIVRVCVSARKANGATVPVRLSIAETAGIRSESFPGPVVRIGSFVYPVQADDASALAYCLRRGDVSLAFKTPGSCVAPFAFFSPVTHSFRPSAGSGCATILSAVECNPPIIQ
jgi:hypothetical protein